MRRTRVKAMVTVPTRRKATQGLPVTEIANSSQQNENCKNVSDDTCVANSSQQSSENKSVEEKMQESVEVDKRVENDNSISDCNMDKDKSVENSEDLKKPNVQSLETSNAIEINSVKSTSGRCSFVKPVPKFNNNNRVRRNSTQGSGASASESEDDNRKVSSTVINCTKNDATQSTQDVKDTLTNSPKNNLKTSCMGQKRRILVSESARKLAEARREFHLKHEHKTPDRTKLTMYDLIYYNPVSNPMKKLKVSTVTTTETVTESQPEKEELEEETEDDPSAIPAPQVKVGPDGRLVIDEKSLVIEQTDAKKNREMEAVIDDDDSGSGFYKRRKKTKDWNKWETLKFYKALNTVGTDFLLMQSLFPNRTREEMKLKFKKEERINRSLVEKALEFHQEFDTEELKKSLDKFENLAKEHSNTRSKRKQQRTKDKKKTKYSKRRKCRIVASSIGEIDESDEEEEEEEQNAKFDSDTTMSEGKTETRDECDQQLNKENKKICKKSKEAKVSSVETDDVESLSSYNDVDSDAEIYRVRPTRSGRLPKVKKLQGPDINSLDNERLNCLSNDEITILPPENAKAIESIILNNTGVKSETDDTIPNMGDVEPGSLVILSKESLDEPGKSVLQVYMVSSDDVSQDLKKSSIKPVDISPDLLATVTAKIADAESVSIQKGYK